MGQLIEIHSIFPKETPILHSRCTTSVGYLMTVGEGSPCPFCNGSEASDHHTCVSVHMAESSDVFYCECPATSSLQGNYFLSETGNWDDLVCQKCSESC